MADDFDIDAVLDRMMHRESGGNVSAVGKAGEIGLHQIKPNVARMYGIDPKLLYNPIVNRYVAKRYLTDLRSSFNGDMRKAVMAYNAGPGRIRSGYVPTSTKAYADYALGSLPLMRASTASGTDRQTLPLMRAPSAGSMDSSGLPLMRAPSSELGSGSIRSELIPEALKTSRPKNTLEIPSRWGASDSSGSTLEIPSRFRPQVPAQFQPNIAAHASTDIGQRLMGALGPASAYAEDIPPGMMVPVGGGKPVPIPKDATVGKPPATPEPFGAKAASWLPTAGQFIGEPLGAVAGAAIPGAGETGVPEYVGATAGGAAGSAAGAELENLVRKHYKLPPVSVGGEAAWGGAGSAVGGLLPLVGRFRKAARLAKQTGSAYGGALKQAGEVEAGLESKLGMSERLAKVLKTAPSTGPRQAYEATRAAGMRELGDEYDKVLGQFYFRPVATNYGEQALAGAAGRNLELVGKPFRQSIEDEFAKQPKTVRGMQRLLMLVRQRMRQLNPDRDRVALAALQDIEKALKRDRNEIIGPVAASAVDNIDYYYAKQAQRFPLSRVRRTIMAPEAAEEILKPNSEGRVLEVLSEMQRTGHVAELRRSFAARLWQKAEVDKALSPDDRMKQIIEAVKDVKPSIFDALYGEGAQKRWLEAANTIGKRQMELLKHPDEAAAIQAKVREYLQSPTVLVKFMESYATHRAFFELAMLGGGAVEGHLGAAFGAIGLIEVYQMVAHSKVAMGLLERAAIAKNPQIVARLMIAALNAGIRGTVETAAGDTDNAP